MGFFDKLLSVFSGESSYSSNGSDNLDGSNHYKLGLAYYKQKNYKKALECFKSAAKSGNISAHLYLGRIFFEGTGVSQNYSLAFKWFKSAAEQGDKNAQFYLGRMYETGKGVKQDKLQAIEWYHKSALQEHERAQSSYNRLRQQSSQREYDYDEQHNNDSAVNSIGKNYDDEAFKHEYGFGRPVNTDRAMELYEEALAAGFQPAEESIKRLQEQRSKLKFDYGMRHNNNPTPNINNPQTNVTNNAANYGLQDKYIKAQNSKLLFDKAVELKRKGQYTAALTLYKSAYESYPDDPDIQSTMYAMAKIYLLIGDYEKACALFQDGLTMKLAQVGERTGRFYQKYVMNRFSGGLSESDPDYQWFQNLTADYSIFIGLSHYLLENEGAELLSLYRYDFNNHMQSVAGKPANRPSAEYLQTCYEYGWVRVILIAGEFADRGLSDIYIDHVKERKQEFLDILKTI